MGAEGRGLSAGALAASNSGTESIWALRDPHVHPWGTEPTAPDLVGVPKTCMDSVCRTAGLEAAPPRRAVSSGPGWVSGRQGWGEGVAQGPWLLRGASLGPGSVVVML